MRYKEHAVRSGLDYIVGTTDWDSQTASVNRPMVETEKNHFLKYLNLSFS